MNNSRSELSFVAAGLVLAVTVPSGALAAEDWPQWRGPRGDNVSLEQAWSSVGRELPLWRADIGRGYSSPAVAGGRLFIAGYFEGEATPGEGLDRVSCLDVETGTLIWSHEYATQAFDNEHRGGALSTPTVFGGTVFVASRGGTVRAFSGEDGALRWEVDLVERHAVDPGRYGFASSPYVLGPDIVLNAGRTIALDRESGETTWASEALDANYSTVAAVQLSERGALAVFGGLGLVLLDASDGSELQRYVFRQTPRNVEGATPIVMGTRVIVSSGYDQGIALVDFGGDEPVEVWRSRNLRTKMAGCTLWNGHLFGFDESLLKCMDLAGKEQWRVRGLGHGALSVAGGRLLVTTSEGELIVAEATPAGFREESRRSVIDGGVFWTAPVLSDGRIFVRGSQGDLVCLDHREEARAGEVGLPAVATAEALPQPALLVARHLEATGLARARFECLRLTGRVHNDSLGLKDSEALWEVDGSRWHTRVSLPFGGMFVDRFFDGELAWEQNPYRGDKLIEGAELQELRRSRGLRDLTDPLGGREATTVGRESFRGADCFRVDVRLAPEVLRSLYFDARTGYLAGRTSALEATVELGDWRPIDGVRVPFLRTEFVAETGEEWRWRFDQVSFEPLESQAFVLPEALRGAAPPASQHAPVSPERSE